MTSLLFDRFEPEAELSRRGQITTWKCRDETGEHVVLKVFEGPTEADLHRIRQRAESLSSLHHRGLAQAKGVAEDEGAIALVYEWVEGETIAQLIERGVRFTDAQLFDCMRQVLEALEHAHSRHPPVIHRDVKPQNIVWTGERYVLIDFGSAREVFADSGNASVVGTTGYAAPEQFVGGSEPRSDQYGLAATVLHMATHQHPTDFPLAGLRIDLTKTSLSVPLRRVLDRMLEPQAERRFDDASVALEAVDTEDGLEPWQVALEPLKSVQSSVSADRNGDQFVIELAPRTSATRWIWYAVAALVMFALYFGLSIVPQILNDPLLGMVLVWGQFVPILFGIYFGSKARQERRSRKRVRLVLTPQQWILEQGNGAPVMGTDRVEVLSAGHSAAQSTGGITPISIRESLILKSGYEEHPFGYGLLPVEAKAVVDAVSAFLDEGADEVAFETESEQVVEVESIDEVVEMSSERGK